MVDSTLAFKRALRARIVAALASAPAIPATSIVDANARPTTFPAVRIGDGAALFANDFDAFAHTLTVDVHVYGAEPGNSEAMEISGRIRNAVKAGPPWIVEGHRVVSVATERARYGRDPNGEHSHATLWVGAVLQDIQ